MDGNKDEAERCISLAEKCILEGKRDKAERFLLKSEKLYSTQKAKDLLESLQRFKSASSPRKKDGTSSESTPLGKGVKKESVSEAEYTKEQLEAVKRIKQCKDYYEILGVTKDVSDSEIKKAYKKLALHLHPDKNRAPGAAEAFKAIGNAVAILTDPEKRKQYDLYGTDEERIRHNTSSHTSEMYTRGFESDVTAEELFNMFFGGAFPSSGNVYVRRNRWQRHGPEEHTQQQQHRDTNNYSILMQMLPILILIALSMMSSLLVSDPVYSLTQNSKFPIKKVTKTLQVPYYVKENFAATYQGSQKRLETSVEEEFIANLRNGCLRERQYRETLLWRAKSYSDQALWNKAQGMKTPSCDTLNQINTGG